MLGSIQYWFYKYISEQKIWFNIHIKILIFDSIFSYFLKQYQTNIEKLSDISKYISKNRKVLIFI